MTIGDLPSNPSLNQTHEDTVATVRTCVDAVNRVWDLKSDPRLRPAQITTLNAGSALAGGELIPVVQAGGAVTTTPDAIVARASAAWGLAQWVIDSVLPVADAAALRAAAGAYGAGDSPTFAGLNATGNATVGGNLTADQLWTAGNNPAVYWTDEDGAADNARWAAYINGGGLRILALTVAGAGGGAVVDIGRDAQQVTAFRVGPQASPWFEVAAAAITTRSPVVLSEGSYSDKLTILNEGVGTFDLSN